MVTRRLFHKVAAVFLKHLLLYVTPRVIGTAKNAPDSDRRDLVGCYGTTSSSKYLKSVHQNLVLRAVYNRKPMRGVQDWCYMFSFMSASD